MNPLHRLISFYRKHGYRATQLRFYDGFRRFSFLGRMVLFSCRLPLEQFSSATDIRIERVTADTLSKRDRMCITNVWNPTIKDRQIADRFAAGSHLWLAKVGNSLAGFGWTIQGQTIAPHFFPLRSDEVHLFDYFVYPEFRGRGINVALVSKILGQLGSERVRFAHIECAAWNQNQIRSLGKTAFRRYAEATKLTFFGHSLVLWHLILESRPEK